ncbi:7-cyano-7-deazaguanine reductase [Schinkia azotoformans MEV2011]|uniref:NADPH-dependent 7-cyano-7-deazaguanine reductase n=1 Tax=Schinkia azotoformans MEV2011 TaxID=1348973 RepID=A0A072NQW2_SCHAZ|nr:preQ(1) synthase [Schinkia azotoformans]KEF40064.1 7-cyano-7-deazaguanine reductase [Schinkia azotoformans MEV2011]MEC1694760.1 preQ(1) synthase [Schinkia azotoformans]MEC1716878.1 preQ(1) synthase [Schinkia azotoformans]MEC1726443.1 preQ(1) synthase [Schinkia azotoformans]MEC1743160.1 preQ(1) synthase [Schinkia azotoformans]
MKENYYLPRSGPMPRPASVEEGREVLKGEAFPAPNVQQITFRAMEFTAVCPKTGQPDFGHVEISYVPNELCIESKSLKFYLWSYRDHGAYCESLAANIADDIVYAINPKKVVVTVYQTARGGIELETQAIREN